MTDCTICNLSFVILYFSRMSRSSFEAFDGSAARAIHVHPEKHPDQTEQRDSAEYPIMHPDRDQHEAYAGMASIRAKLLAHRCREIRRDFGEDKNAAWEMIAEMRAHEIELETIRDRLVEERSERGDAEAEAFADSLESIVSAIKEVKNALNDMRGLVEKNNPSDSKDIGETEEDESGTQILNETHLDALMPPAVRINTETAKRELDAATQTEVSQAMDKAFDPYIESSPLLIPGNLQETRSKFLEINRFINGIETSLHEATNKNKDLFDAYLSELSHFYTEMEERLTLLLRASPNDEIAEEKEIIADAMHLIEDLRDRIHQEYAPDARNTRAVEEHLELKTIKKNLLEKQAKKLTDLLKRSGMEHPEITMSESGGIMGPIRRGLGGLFGTGPTIDEYDLQKISDAVANIERTHLKRVYSDAERLSAIYAHREKHDPLLNIEGSTNPYKIWETIHNELEDLDEQLSSALGEADRGQGSAKASVRRDHALSEETEAARNLRMNEILEAKRAGVKEAETIAHTIANDPNVGDLSFFPTDYVARMGQLALSVKQMDRERMPELIKDLEEMNEELRMIGIETKPAETLIKRTKAALALPKPKRKK